MAFAICHQATSALVALLILSEPIAAQAAAKLERQNNFGRIQHEVYDRLRPDVEQSAHTLLTKRQESLKVPLEVNVALLGFNSDGAYNFQIDENELSDFFTKSFPEHQPSCLETGQPLEISYQLKYNVFHVSPNLVTSLQNTIRASLVLTGRELDPDVYMELPTYELNTTAVEERFDVIYKSYFGQKLTEAQEGGNPGPAVIFIANFDKMKMNPNDTAGPPPMAGGVPLNDGGFLYRYRYMNSGLTSAWLGAGRYVVADISAGPCSYGRISASEGVIGPFTLPRLRRVIIPRWKTALGREETEKVRRAKFRGQLSTLVMSAVQHLIAPDIRFETLDSAERVLVPIIVLRNHALFNPFVQGPEAIDLHQMETEIKRLAQPNQEVVVVGAVHSLHEHGQLAVALAKATRGASVHVPSPDNRQHTIVSKTYVDGAVLIEEMRHTADVLAAGMLEVAHPDVAKSFFDQPSPGAADDGSAREEPAKRGGKRGGKKQPGERRRLAQKSRGPSRGTRVVPVYVLSLAGMDQELLLEGETLYAASPEAVIVLQTNANRSIPTSYVSESEVIHINPAAPTRHIIAGVASVLSGLAAPHERWSVIRNRAQENWMWANGHHPFGPFSNCSGLSELLLDTSLRNAIFSRVDTAIRGVRDAVLAIEEFANEYLRTPFGANVSAPPAPEAYSSPLLWMEKLYSDPERTAAPLPHATVERLQMEIKDIEDRLVLLGGLLYEQNFADAHKQSSSLLWTVRGFRDYVEAQLEAARDGLACCKVKHSLPVAPTSEAFLYAGILAAGLLVYFVVIFFSTPQR